MKIGLKAAFLAIVLATVPAIDGVGAHHSGAMYDSARPITIRGEVRRLNWLNPHVMLIVNGAPAGQPVQDWLVEMSSPGVMTRSGWTKRSLKPGDKVTIEVSPLRSGAPGGGLRSARIDATGEVLKWDFSAGEKAGLQ